MTTEKIQGAAAAPQAGAPPQRGRHLPKSSETATAFHKSGHEVWLHLPMEPRGHDHDPGLPGLLDRLGERIDSVALLWQCAVGEVEHTDVHALGVLVLNHPVDGGDDLGDVHRAVGVGDLDVDDTRFGRHPEKRFGDRFVQHQGALDFGGAEIVAGDDDDVVDTSRDPVIAILVATCAVTGKIHTGIGAEIGVDETLVVAVDRADLAGPGGLYHQVAGAGPLDLGALLVEQRQVGPLRIGRQALTQLPAGGVRIERKPGGVRFSEHPGHGGTRRVGVLVGVEPHGHVELGGAVGGGSSQLGAQRQRRWIDLDAKSLAHRPLYCHKVSSIVTR